ncbi:MAG: hemolysin III family protein [Bacteroidia bacterium]|nr:hemolysin III family protein [Bacteroidia bacterium]
MSNEKFYTPREERANYLSHAAGVLLAIAATVLLLRKAVIAADAWAVAAYAVFGFGMLVCMLSSTIYHYVQEPKTKAQMRHFDHASIYLLIAASYSPFTLILLREARFWGWLLFGLVWAIALVGIAVSFGTLKRNSHLKTASYVLMGLVVLIAFKPLIETANEKNCIEVIWWLVAGGVFYIAGAVIYATAKREFVHALFHVFVLLGLVSHIVSAYLIPLSG